jgi:hypothetical protein
MTSAIEAFKKIADEQAIFISRGDESGTHTKELGIWKKAEIEPAGDWYVSAGQGMGEVLTMASEQEGYTLSDRATYLARSKEGLDLAILVEGDKDLFNPYGVIAVNPDKGAHIKAELADQFIDWIISLPVQKINWAGRIRQSPSFDLGWREAHPAETAGEAGEAVSGAAALKIRGLVSNEMGWSEEKVKAMEAITVESTNKDGQTSSYTGVPLKELLALAGPTADATMLVFVADDGYTAEVTIAEVEACDDCIVSFRNQGGFALACPFPACR